MEEKIIELLKRVLETDSVNANTSKDNCGNWDSMHHLMLVVELESLFGVELQPEEIEAMNSVTTIVHILSTKQ